MNRKALIVIAAGIVSLSSCATVQRQLVENALDKAAKTPEPSVQATVDCNTFTFTVTGYPQGADVFIEVGAEPPYGFTVGGNLWHFAPTDGGGATGSVAIPDYEAAAGFEAIIDINTPDAKARVFDQTVAPC